MEYKDIVKLLQNPDKVPEGLSELDAYNAALTKERDDLKTAHDADDKRIRDLQDTNMRLYLKQTGKADDEPEDTRNDYEKLIDLFKSDNGGKS